MADDTRRQGNNTSPIWRGRSPIIAVELFRGSLFQHDQDNNDPRKAIASIELPDVGPNVESSMTHYQFYDVNTYFRCSLAAESNFEGGDWTQLGLISDAFSATAPTFGKYAIDGPCEHPEYFGRNLRFAFRYWSSVDNTMASAKLSLMVYLKLWGQ